jgi:quercetin dioxygenase-like cupin family protein
MSSGSNLAGGDQGPWRLLMPYQKRRHSCDPAHIEGMSEYFIVSHVRRHASSALLLLALCTAGGTSAQSQDTDTGVVRLPQDIVYKGLPGAPQHVTMFGDSSKPELYVDRIKFEPGMKVMPHWHPDLVRTVLVLSGTFYFAVGEQWDENQLKAYPAGTLYSEPARTPHYAWAKDGEVILQVTAIGPTGNTPIPQKIK